MENRKLASPDARRPLSVVWSKMTSKFSSEDNNNTTTYKCHIYIKREKEKKITRSITVCPSVWSAFQQAVRINDPFSNASQTLEDYMVTFITQTEDRNQPRITQFFINKPQTVNIAENQVVTKVEHELPDLENMSLEELQREYDRAVGLREHGRRMVLAYELKKRRGY